MIQFKATKQGLLQKDLSTQAYGVTTLKLFLQLQN